MTRYVALLRGINVGGKNLIPMAELRACFEEAGFEGLATYIQSGNVIFGAGGGRAALTRRIEKLLATRFGYDACVVLRTAEELRAIVRGAPKGFGRAPAKYRYDVIFLKEPLTAAAAIRDVPTREGVDQAWAGKGVLYFSRLIARATQSRLSRITSMPVYQRMTIRNWNTTTALLKRVAG